MQHAQSALRFDPGHEPAQKLRRRVKDVERLKEEGNNAFRAGKHAEAVERYSEAIDVSLSTVWFSCARGAYARCTANR
jgi:DnaJ family protein C protein 7